MQSNINIYAVQAVHGIMNVAAESVREAVKIAETHMESLTFPVEGTEILAVEVIATKVIFT